MARTASDGLFRLIHSLNRTEKGYVKRYCSRHVVGDGNDYLRLFDIIDSQEQYNEALVKSKLADTAMARRLSAVKNYLYQQILEAMRSYHASSSHERQIVELLEDADFLWEKTLYDQSMRRVIRARELAIAHDEYPFWLKTLSWEKNYRHVVLDEPATDGAEDALSVEQRRVLELLRNTIDYENLGNTFHDNLIRSTKGDTVARDWLKRLPTHDLLQSPATATARPAKLNYHLILSNWWSFVGDDPDRSVGHTQALVDLMMSDDELRNARPDTFLGILYNHAVANASEQRSQQFAATMSLLWDEDHGHPSRNIEVKRYYRAVNAECTYALHTGDHSRILGRMAFIREKFDGCSEFIPPQSRVALCFMCGRIAHEHRRNRESDWWFRRLSMCDDSIRPDLHAAARMLQLQRAMMDRDVDYVRPAVRTLRRFLQSYNLTSTRTDAILSLFRRYAESHGLSSARLIADTARRLAGTSPSSSFDPVSNSGIDAWILASRPSTAKTLQPAFNI